MPETKRSKRVRFSYQAPGVKAVMLAGDFTDWMAGARPMRRDRPRSSTFATTVSLPPGSYQYKFVVDGEWVEDPKSSASIANCFGTRNSLLTVA